MMPVKGSIVKVSGLTTATPMVAEIPGIPPAMIPSATEPARTRRSSGCATVTSAWRTRSAIAHEPQIKPLGNTT